MNLWQGEQVEEFQPLCEVQSDKATIEITSRYKGRVSKVLHVPGDIVKVIIELGQKVSLLNLNKLSLNVSIIVTK